jgi:hypothetical protein
MPSQPLIHLLIFVIDRALLVIFLLLTSVLMEILPISRLGNHTDSIHREVSSHSKIDLCATGNHGNLPNSEISESLALLPFSRISLDKWSHDLQNLILLDTSTV